MSEHSLKELKRQLDDAKSKLHYAQQNAALATRRFHEARCRETGLMNQTVKTRKGANILVHDVEFLSGSPYAVKGFAFKKDGSVGFAERRVYVSDLDTTPKPSSEPTP